MILDKSNMKKMCSFCVSDWHIATTILPYVKEKTENEEKIISIFERGIENNIIELLKRMGINKSSKNRIAEIDWETKSWNRYEQFEYFMEQNYSKDMNVIINGNEEYIGRINSYMDKWFEKNSFRIKRENSNVNVISCYDMSEGITRENILEKYDYVLNTSGEKDVREFLGLQSNNKLKIAK